MYHKTSAQQSYDVMMLFSMFTVSILFGQNEWSFCCWWSMAVGKWGIQDT